MSLWKYDVIYFFLIEHDFIVYFIFEQSLKISC